MMHTDIETLGFAEEANLFNIGNNTQSCEGPSTVIYLRLAVSMHVSVTFLGLGNNTDSFAETWALFFTLICMLSCFCYCYSP